MDEKQRSVVNRFLQQLLMDATETDDKMFENTGQLIRRIKTYTSVEVTLDDLRPDIVMFLCEAE